MITLGSGPVKFPFSQWGMEGYGLLVFTIGE